MKRCTTRLKTKVFPYHPTKLAIHSLLRSEADPISKCGLIPKETIPFDDILQFIDEENIVTYVEVGCGITFYPEVPTKNGQTNGQRENVSRSCEKPKCIPSNNQNNCSFDKEHTSNIFLNPYEI